MPRKRQNRKNVLYSSSQLWTIAQIKELVLAIGLLILIMVIGAAGFMIIENWSLLDSLYMSVMTISTVGYGEVYPLSEPGKIFTTVLIGAGMCVAAYAFFTIGRTAIEGELHKYRRLYIMNKKISDLNGHIIICGFGRLARHTYESLANAGKEIVVIDKDPKVIEELERNNILYIEGNADHDQVLIQAGIEKATKLLSLLPSDTDNVYVTLSARALNPMLTIFSRTELPEGENKLLRAGANKVISPYQISGLRLVQSVLHPHISDFLEVAENENGERLVLEKVKIPGNSKLVGSNLEESGIRDKTGLLVAAYIDANGKTTLSPGRDCILGADATIVVFGTNQSLTRLGEIL